MTLKFVFLNQYYPPDLAPTGLALHDLARTLVSRGHEVRVVCSRRGYSGSAETAGSLLEGVTVRRVPALGFGRATKIGRILDYASYVALAFFECLRPSWRPDAVVALTTPPYLGVMARVVAVLRRAVHVQWLMDLYPDGLIADGMLSERGLVAGGFAAMTRAQFRNAAAVIALGDFMAARAQRYWVGKSVASVPLWSFVPAGAGSDEAISAVRTDRGWRAEDVVLLYSGNMGRGHRFSEFLAAAERLGPAGPVWAFAGGGYRRREVEEFARAHTAARVQLWPYVPAERLVDSLSAADVHLVSLDRAWEGVMVPSKLQGAFAVGRAVLFVGGHENEAAAWIAESGGGWVVREGDVEGLLNAVDQAKDPAERSRRGAAALAFARDHFDRARNCARIAEILENTGARTSF